MDTYDLSRLAASFVLPLAEALEDPDMEEALAGDLGFVLPAGVTVIGGTRPAIETLAALVIEMEDYDPLQGGSPSDLLERAALAFRSVVAAVHKLADGLNAEALESALVRETDLLQVLPRRLIDYLCVDFSQNNLPLIHELLRTCGIIEVNEGTPRGRSASDDVHRTHNPLGSVVAPNFRPDCTNQRAIWMGKCGGGGYRKPVRETPGAGNHPRFA